MDAYMFMRSFIMNWKTIFAASLLLTSVNISEVLAGVEPSPFQPEINQLGAIANILQSADFRVAKSIAHPPEPCVPPDPCNSPDLNGAVNRLEAISNQVSSADDMVKAMIEEVMGFEPTPFRTEDLIPALEVVRDAGSSISARIGDFTPDPNLSIDYLEALEGVADKAADVVETSQWGIDEFGMRCPCFSDSEWSRIWSEWPAIDASNQCAEILSAYSFELGHWVFGDSQAREFIAVVDIVGRTTACRIQHGNPSSSYDIQITSDQVQFCADMMRVKAADEGVTCIID